MIIGWTNLGIIALGTLLSLVGIYGAFAKKIRSIAVPAIVGLVVNGILIASFLSILLIAREFSQKRAAISSKTREQQAADAEQEGVDVVEKYAGWLGATRLPGAVVTVTQWNDDAPGTREMKSYFSNRMSLMQIAIDNSGNSERLIVNPDSLVLHFNDGTTVKAIGVNSILSSAKEDRDKWMAQAARARISEPHTKQPNCSAFVPEGTDFTHVSQISVEVNGEDVVVPGRFYSAEEKKTLVERAKHNAPAGSDPQGAKPDGFHL